VIIDDTVNDWIKDGTKDKTPVTSSTPAVETAAPAETTEASSSPARDPETGKFVAATASAEGVTATPAATAEATASAEATPVVEAAAAAAGQSVEEFLEARRGDQPYKFPKDVELPWKRGNESGFIPITEVLKSPMFEKDYRHKTQQVAEERRQVSIEKARIAAEKTAIDAERQQLREAMIDPEKLEQYQQHYEQMRTNPVYKKMVEDALDARVTRAELDVRLAEESEQVNREAAENLYNTIVETAKQYPGVDPERVRQVYAKGLVSGDIQEITEESIHQVYKQEAGYTAQILSPLQAELTELRAQIDTLKGTKAAEAHNANTDKKLAQAKATPVVAAVGNATPVGTSTPPTQFKPFTLHDYPQKISEWSKRV
jgi:hypothetical protein